MPELLSGVVSISLWAHGQRKALTLPNLLSWGKSPTTKGGRPLLPKGWLVWMLNAWALVTMVHLQATEKAKHSWPAYATLSTRACRNLREEGKGLSQREPKRQQTDQWQKKKYLQHSGEQTSAYTCPSSGYILHACSDPSSATAVPGPTDTDFSFRVSVSQ